MKPSKNKSDAQESIQEEQINPIVPAFSEIIKNNPSGFILRTRLSEQTGGLLHGRTMANLDSLGTGIPDRITVGNRKVAYPVQSVIAYLQSKTTIKLASEK